MKNQRGFTLIEVMVAIVILGSAGAVLLGSHMMNLTLFTATRTAVETRTLLEQAIGHAEIMIHGGELSGEEECGPHYPDARFKWNAELAPDAGDGIELYQVTVSVVGKIGDEEVQEQVVYMIYNIGFVR